MKYIETIFPAMGTANSIAVTVEEKDAVYAKSILSCIKSCIDDMDDRLSIFKPESLISRINQGAGKYSIPADPDTFRLLQQSKRCSEQTAAAFDVTVKPMSDIWRIKRDGGKADIRKAHVGFRDLLLNDKDMTVRLRQRGEGIDLGGIAKGYAVDAALKILEQNGIKNAIVNLGGTAAVKGAAASVGIRNPFLPVNRSAVNDSIAELMCRNEVIVTSGTYEQFFMENGKSVHHILDPRTGSSTETDLISATLIGKNGAQLDAFATACIVLGTAKSVSLCRKHGIEAVFIRTDGSIYATSGIRNRFTVRKEAAS